MYEKIDILNSIKRTIEESKSITIDKKRLAEVAAEFAEQPLSMPHYEVPNLLTSIDDIV
jgi:hypothetical protein